MFICENCGKAEGVDSFWFIVGPLSRGNCEICGKGAVCYDWQGYKKSTAPEKTELQKAMEIVVAEMAKDKSEGSYYYSWQANIAMAFQDEVRREFNKDGDINMTAVELHAVSNIAARNFLDMLVANQKEQSKKYNTNK